MVHSRKFVLAVATLALTAACERRTVLTPDDIVPSTHTYLTAPASVEAASQTSPSGFGFEVADPALYSPAPPEVEYVTTDPVYVSDEGVPVETGMIESDPVFVEDAVVFDNGTDAVVTEYTEAAPEIIYAETPPAPQASPVYVEPLPAATNVAPQPLLMPGSGSYGSAF